MRSKMGRPKKEERFTKDELKDLMKESKNNIAKAALLANVTYNVMRYELQKNGFKLPSSKRISFTRKQVLKFLEETSGNINKASDLAGCSFGCFLEHLNYYKLQAVPDQIKCRIAHAALERAKYLALTPASLLKKNGEKFSEGLLREILNQWGHLIEFGEKPNQKVENQGNTWVTILQEVDPQRKKDQAIEIEQAEVVEAIEYDSGDDSETEID